MKKMFSLFLALITLFSLSACDKDNPTEELSSAQSMRSITEPIASFPTLESTLSAALSNYLKVSFGGDGKPEYAASWYHHILKEEIYKDGDTYFASVTLQDKSVKYSKSMKVLQMYFTNDDIDNFLSGMCGAAEKFELDVTDLALLGEAFYNIANKGDPMYYYSVQSLGVPIFSLLSDATGETETRIKNDVQNGAIDGQQAASVALTAMNKAYSGESSQVTNKELKTIARTIMANFRDVSIAQVNFVDSSGSDIESIKMSN